MKKLLAVALGLASIFLIAQHAFAAIAFDSADTWTTGATVTSITTSHTIGVGQNMILFALSFTTNNDASASYNGVSMTKIVSQVGSDTRALALFVLPNPASGTHNLVISVPSSEAIVQGGGISYSGAAQTAVVDATTSTSTASFTPSFTGSLTTHANNSWAIMGARMTGGTGLFIASGTNMGFRTNGTFTGLGDTNAPISPAGVINMTVNNGTGSSTFYTVMASFAPASSTASEAIFFAGD
jgi:hypothetical protein